MHTPISRSSRIQGAIMGAFIGDALALGPHWYYDLKALRQDYGEWIDTYLPPKKGRYHQGLEAGESSQSGIILAMLLRSVLDCQGYEQEHFCQQLDNELLAKLNGTANFGPGGFTSHSMRDAYQARQQGKAWGSFASLADNTEACERIIAIALLYSNSPQLVAEQVIQNTSLTQSDPIVGAMTCAYALILSQLIQGEAFDSQLSGKLMALWQRGDFVFPFASPDALLSASSIAQAVQDEQVRIEPTWKVSLLYGLPCAIYHQLPAVYHLTARFGADFKAAVLHAINGGGQNMARAMLTGALCGAIGGLEAIPQRFIDGLKQGPAYLRLAQDLATLANNPNL